MTIGKTIALTRRTFVGKVMSLLFNMLSRLVVAFLPRGKRLLICCCCSVTQFYMTLCNPMDYTHQVSLSFTVSWSLLKLMSTESVMPSNHLVLCHPLLHLPSIFPRIRVFSMSQFFASGDLPHFRDEETEAQR